MIKRLRHHGLLIGVILVYVVVELSLLNWGLPSQRRVFTYHMDEWHSLMAIKSIWQQGTNNVAGAANGTMGHFLLSGLSLIPLVLTRFIDIRLMDSAVTGLEMQRRIFQVLRLNTLVFGVLAALMVYLILKKHFRVKPSWGIVMLVFSPAWLVFSNYFRYDIALVFWILLALWWMLRYGKDLKRSSYLWAGITTGLAIATKLSALPLLALYFFAFFYYSKREKRDYRLLFWGLSIAWLVVVFWGVPDWLLGTGDYRRVIEMIRGLESMVELLPGMSWWRYWLLIRLPESLGYGLVLGFLLALVIRLKQREKKKDEWFLLIGLMFFLISLGYLKMAATSNRILVLLPFLVVISGAVLSRKKVLTGLMILLMGVQVGQGWLRVRIKWQLDPRQVASDWLEQEIPRGQVIGLENIPIYQMIPDGLLKDFYWQEHGLTSEGKHSYRIVEVQSDSLPEVMVITNHDQTKKKAYEQKQALIERLKEEGYEEAVSFSRSVKEFDSIPSRISVFRK